MDNRYDKSESGQSGLSVVVCRDSGLEMCKGHFRWHAETRSGCFATTERHLNGRTNNRPWLRPKDGVAGTGAYIKRLQVGQK